MVFTMIYIGADAVCHPRMSAIHQPKPNLTQSAYERLKADLLACKFVPDERLKIGELCERLGVSLGAVREALSRVTSEGLVIAEPQRGFRVAPVSAEELADLYQARVELEGLCLRRSIQAGGVPWEASVVAAYHSLSRTPDIISEDGARVGEEWLRRHAEFHSALVGGCESPWLLRLRTQLFDHAQRYRRLSVSLTRTKRNVDKEHRELMEAVLARDADRAVALMREHLQITRNNLLKCIPNLHPANE